MATSIPANNNTGLYNTTGGSQPLSGNVVVTNLSAIGNITAGGNFVGNGAALTGVVAANAGYANTAGFATTAGTANTAGSANTAAYVTANAQANITSVGTLTSLSVSGNVQGGNLRTVGSVSATGNITGNYILGNGSQLSGLPIPNLANYAGSISATGNITAGANISGQYILGNGSQLTGMPVLYGNANVSNYLASGTNTANIITTANITGGNLTTTGTGGNITGVNFASANYFVGDGSYLTNVSANTTYGNANVVTLLSAFGSNTISTTGNITSGYVFGNGSQLTGIAASYGNANVNTLLAAWGSNALSTTGNVTAGYVFGNGSQLTGLPATYSNANVTTLLANFGSNSISTTGNVTASYVVGNGSLLSSLAGANVTGVVANATYAVTAGSATTSTNAAQANYANIANSVSGSNVSGTVATATLATYATTANAVAGGNVTGSVAQANLANTANSVAGANVSGQVANALVAGTVYGATQSNITTVGTLTVVNTSGAVSAVGNITGGNLGIGNNATIGGNLSVVGTIYGTFAGNITGNLVVPGSNTQVIYNNNGNAGASANFTFNSDTNQLSVAGNVVAANINGNGSGLSSITGANVTGTVAQATVANTANAVAGGNVSGQVANALVAGTVYTNAQPNITSVGTLSSLSVTGNVTGGNILSGTFQAVNSGGGTLKNSGGTTQAAWGAGGGDNFAINVSTNINGANAQIDISPTGNSGHVHIKPTGTPSIEIAPTYSGSINNMVIGNATPAAATVTTLSTTGNITAAGILTDGYYYANGVPFSGGGGSTYGNANVATFLAAFGSNTISTTGNVSAGNLIVTGVVVDQVANLDLQTTAVNGNINLLPNGTGKVSTTSVVTAGAVTYANADGTVGQVLTTYGNGITYFSTVSGGGGSPGGSNTQIQFNNAGAFAGNAAMAFDNTTGNITLGNTVYNALSVVPGGVVPNTTPTAASTPSRMVIGRGFNGNTNAAFNIVGTSPSGTGTGVRLLETDTFNISGGTTRVGGLGAQNYYILNANIANTVSNSIVNNTQFTAVVGGNTALTNGYTNYSTNTFAVQGITNTVVIGAGTLPNLSAVGNTRVSFVRGQTNNITLSYGSNIDVAIGTVSSVLQTNSSAGVYANIANAVAFASVNTSGANGLSAVNQSTNFAHFYIPGDASSILTSANAGANILTGNVVRAATNYYAFRNDDDLAKVRLGSLIRFNEHQGSLTSSGSITVDKNSGQVQFATLTGNLTISGFSNFVTNLARPQGTSVLQTDTVTLILDQGTTGGYTVTFPSDGTCKFAGGISAVGTVTANTVSMVSVTGYYNSTAAATNYLITISPGFA